MIKTSVCSEEEYKKTNNKANNLEKSAWESIRKRVIVGGGGGAG